MKKRWFILAASCAILVVVLVVALASAPAHQGFTGQLNTGMPVQVAEGSVGSEGGTIVVDSSGASALNGMTITVPGGAYDTSVDFEISEAPILSQTFGEDFKPITPLISVDNGEEFANEPLEVTIPIHLEEGQFAMGFYYDEETGTLEGIPLLDETDRSITLMTRHFSDIYIAMAEKGNILGCAMDGINTGFEPGKNDFIMPNNGSYLQPMGHCAGQSIAVMHYYLQAGRSEEWNDQLYGRFDNNELGNDTPAFWNDDANAMRMCTVMQQQVMAKWKTGAEIAEYHKFTAQHNDKKTFYALAYAMMGTGAPQLVYCARSNAAGAHLVLAYKIEGDVIYLADPNFPADTGKDRRIKFDRAAAAANMTDPKLTPYYSAPNAEEAKQSGVKPYDVIAYYGMYALLDEDLVDSIWQELLDGDDPGYLDFPADMDVLAFTGLEESETGETKKDLVYITEDLTLYEDRLADTAAGGGKLFFAIEYPEELKYLSPAFSVYIGDEEVFAEEIPSMPGFYAIDLQPGENDVGFELTCRKLNFEERGYRFINFYRFKVNYDNSGTVETGLETLPPVETTEEPPVESTGTQTDALTGTWQETLSEIALVGTGPVDLSSDNILSRFDSGKTIQDNFSIEMSGGEHIVPPVYDGYDQNWMSIDNYSSDQPIISITRVNSATGTSIQLNGVLSPDGQTISGSFVVYFSDDINNFYIGNWTALHN